MRWCQVMRGLCLIGFDKTLIMGHKKEKKTNLRLRLMICFYGLYSHMLMLCNCSQELIKFWLAFWTSIVDSCHYWFCSVTSICVTLCLAVYVKTDLLVCVSKDESDVLGNYNIKKPRVCVYVGARCFFFLPVFTYLKIFPCCECLSCFLWAICN